MTGNDPEPAQQLRQEAQACRRMAMDRRSTSGDALLNVAQYFENHARRLDRLRDTGW